MSGIRHAGSTRVHELGDAGAICGARLGEDLEKVAHRMINCPRCIAIRTDRKRRRTTDETTGTGYPIGQIKIISPLSEDKLPKVEITTPFGATRAEMDECRRIAVDTYFATLRDVGAR